MAKVFTIKTTEVSGTTRAYVLPAATLAAGTIIRALSDDDIVCVELIKSDRVTVADGLDDPTPPAPFQPAFDI